ncbi:MAG: Crp/Fnr family transcriptional regulator [Bacteroidota bacterium]
MREITVKKGQILQRQGDVGTKAFLVKSGLLRSYSIDEKGKEHVFLFASEGTVVVDHMPPEQPADLFIDALENSTVVAKEKSRDFAKRDALKIVGRITLLQKRVIMLMSSSVIERYRYFVKTYPNITERVPQKMIASYLGVTPEALSKAKRGYLLAK